jgi:flagellar protein FlgJ
MPLDPLSSPLLPLSASLNLSAPPFQTAQRLAVLADQATAGQPAANANLRKATQMFEATFVSWLLREMRQTVPQSDLLPKGPADETYDQLYDNALGESIARGNGLGLAQLLEAKLRSAAAARAAAASPTTQEGAGTTSQTSGPVYIGGKR